MVFSSLTFIYLYLPLTLIIYFAVPHRARNMVLFLSGLFFYAWGEPVYVIIMIISMLIDYIAGLCMARFHDKPKMRTLFLLLSVVMNLSLLAVFKYNSFVVNNLNSLFGLSITDPKIPLPIGISFYTFQSMSYTIDLYRRNVPVQKSFVNFAAYVSMFPQIVAGPIVRYDDVRKELENRKVTFAGLGEGVGIFVQGLAKKVLLANNIGSLWTYVKALPENELTVAMSWIGILAFTFQIYFDFSGYSDMAVGMGRMLGFYFPQNFNYPYLSKSVTEFWRRWHITLGTWFREYVYIPLGGNRKGLPRTLINLLITWMLTGLWHGASWNFVLWGLYYGIILIIERLFLSKVLMKLPKLITQIYTFFIVVIGWVMFELTTVSNVFGYIGAMFGANGAGFGDADFIYRLASYAIVFILCAVFSTDITKKLSVKLYKKNPAVVKYGAIVLQIVIMLICTAYLVDATYNPFLYFRF